MRRHAAAAAVVLVLLAAATALATSYHRPNIDGHVTTAAGDWAADELVWHDPNNDNRYYPYDGDLVNLYVTWDADSLYIGLTTVNGPGTYGNGYVIYIDTDAQNGITGVTDFTNVSFYKRNITLSTMGADAELGVWNLNMAQLGIKDIRDPLNPLDISDTYTQINPGFKHIETGIGWDGLYGLGRGAVPAGTTLRFICVVTGTDGTGAYDALPTSSTGIESDPATPYDAYTNLDVYVEIPVDANHDGVPDVGYPPNGLVSGTVTYDDPTDLTTVATLTAYQNGVEVRSADTDPGGGDYLIDRLATGTYDITATAPTYLPETIEGVSVVDTLETPDIDFLLHRVTGRISGDVALSGGPDVDVAVTAYDSETGLIGGEGTVIVPGGTGAFSIGTIVDGTWNVVAEAKGYVEQEIVAVIASGDTADVGHLSLPAVVATRYAFANSFDDEIESVDTTVSLPELDTYYYAMAWVQPRDDDGRVAYWDYDAQGDVSLAATKLDPAHAPSGSVILADEDEIPLVGGIVPAGAFEDGKAPFLVADDEVEVLRISAQSGDLEGAVQVGVLPPAPIRLSLSSDVSSMQAGTGVAHITGQLVDASGNASQVSGVIASMSMLRSTGTFSVPTPITQADGKFEIDFTSTAADTALVSASIDPSSPVSNLAVDTLAIIVTPGEASVVDLVSAPRSLRLEDTATIDAQVRDAFGNDVPLGGLSIALTGTPGSLVGSIESPVVTDGDGHATADLVSDGSYGVLRIEGAAGSTTVSPIDVPIDATIRAMDPVAPEPNPPHSDPGLDLTALMMYNTTDELVVGMIFDSTWDRAHVGIAIETKGDAAGATTEPFIFPINYGYTLLPDYAFTFRVNGDPYSDFRRWNTSTGKWEWQDWDTGGWIPVDGTWVQGVASLNRQVFQEGDMIWFHLPFSVIEVAPGDTVRVEGYTMQEVDGGNVKYTALDSTPSDATHDMTGDWWETAEDPVTLSHYAAYTISPLGAAPVLSEGGVDPDFPAPGDLVTYTVRVTNAGRSIGDVFIDLTSVGGDQYVRMTDDGVEPDAVAGDGIYTAADVLSRAATDGDHLATVTAWDGPNEEFSTLDIVVTVNNPTSAIRSFEDPSFDDHGPNGGAEHPGEQTVGLYYEYPTNLVFLPGSFDITRVDILPDGDRIVFRTYIRDLVNHQDPSAADWGAPQPAPQTCDNPYRTDLNLQKVDIYIDAKEGEGSTSGFPNRYVDIAPVDAWEYGISVEGWGKWFVDSQNSSSIAGWQLYKNDSDITICDDYVDNYIDISVNRERLGLDPDNLDDNEAILNWDIIVTLSSHDGDSTDDNLGGIRWVNANIAEWQFGGGSDGEGGRERDSNIIDVATSPGQGHAPGRTQEEMLDYTTPEAQRRFSEDKVACLMEASFAVDTSPPVIYAFASPSSPGVVSWTSSPSLASIRWLALNGAPAVMWTRISDVSGISAARFHWYPVGEPALEDSVDMVNLTGEIWAADISRQEIVAHTNVVPLVDDGEGRVIEAWVEASDASINANSIRTPLQTFDIMEPWSDQQTVTGVDTLGLNDEAFMVFQDGTILAVQGSDLQDSQGQAVHVTVTPLPGSFVDVSNIRDDMEFVSVARDITARLEGGETLTLTGYPSLTLHYPQYEVGGLNEKNFGIFGWVPETERWIFKGGASDPVRNAVTSEIGEEGLFGIFSWDTLDVGSERGLSGVLVEPNPFSPNGDGLYETTDVSFFLGRGADYVNVEFYDLSGRLVRRLVFQAPTEYTGRTPAKVTWDGKDSEGRIVPYGIYVMRMEAKFKTEPTFERVNIPVAVIK
jgi:hypothetical protein